MRPPRESFGALKKRRVRGWSGSFLFPPPFLLFFFAHFLFLSVLTNERWGGKEKGEKGEKIRASEETVLLPPPFSSSSFSAPQAHFSLSPSNFLTFPWRSWRWHLFFQFGLQPYFFLPSRSLPNRTAPSELKVK